MIMSTNRLSDGELERLAKLGEECGEVQQMIGKILRFGFDSNVPGTDSLGEPLTTRARLEEELGHVAAVQTLMIQSGDITFAEIMYAKGKHRVKMQKFMHHQGSKDDSSSDTTA